MLKANRGRGRPSRFFCRTGFSLKTTEMSGRNQSQSNVHLINEFLRGQFSQRQTLSPSFRDKHSDLGSIEVNVGKECPEFGKRSPTLVLEVDPTLWSIDLCGRWDCWRRAGWTGQIRSVKCIELVRADQ